MELLSGEARRRLERENPALLERAERESGVPAREWTQIEMDVNRQPENQVYEFENLEELRAFDPRYRNHSDNEAMALVARVFRVPESRIQGIRCLKAGMTNQSFLFQVEEKQYICRIPGPGTELLVNRVQEAKAYEAVRQLGITENLIYLNPENGYKIAEYFPDSRNVSAESWTDMERFMGLIRTMHQGGVRVSHRFDMRERIDFYETLCKTHGGVLFEDYGQVREQMNWLMDRLDEMERPLCLCHIDANVDNGLILPDGRLRLLDWEYAGMCDPLIDVAMCAIYSYYDDEQLDHHRGAPDDGDVNFANQVEHRQHRVVLALALLVVAGADDGHQDAQHHTNEQCHHGDQKGDAQALKVLHPPAFIEPGPVEFHINVLPQVWVFQGLVRFVQLGKIHLHTPLSQIPP